MESAEGTLGGVEETTFRESRGGLRQRLCVCEHSPRNYGRGVMPIVSRRRQLSRRQPLPDLVLEKVERNAIIERKNGHCERFRCIRAHKSTFFSAK